MKQEKLAQDKKQETARIINQVETMREDIKKALSPNGAIDCSQHNSTHEFA
jgi:hypothetical protein